MQGSYRPLHPSILPTLVLTITSLPRGELFPQHKPLHQTTPRRTSPVNTEWQCLNVRLLKAQSIRQIWNLEVSQTILLLFNPKTYHFVLEASTKARTVYYSIWKLWKNQYFIFDDLFIFNYTASCKIPVFAFGEFMGADWGKFRVK